MLIIKLLVSLCCCLLALGTSLFRSPTTTHILDQIVFGNKQSELDHAFSGPGTILGSRNDLSLQYHQNLTYRQIGPDPNNTQHQTLTGNQSTFITITIHVDPLLPTYITLKLYGSDNQTGTIMLYWKPPEQPPIESLYPGMVSIGSGLLQLGWYDAVSGTKVGGYVPLDVINRGFNAYPRHFYYATTVLPLEMTRNRTSLRILLGGWGNVNGYTYPVLQPLDHSLKPIYRLYSHLEAFYEPLPSPINDEQMNDINNYEAHTIEPIPQVPSYPLWMQESQPISKQELINNYTMMKNTIESLFTDVLKSNSASQVYGEQWNATLDIYNPENPYATPSVLWGAPFIPFSLTKAKLTHSQWLNQATYRTTNSNNDPLELFAALAFIYQSNWSIHYHDQTILDRVIAGLDYYMHEQDSNGCFLATNPNIGWHGAPNRTRGLGNALDGIGPYSLAQVVILLYDDLDKTGKLDELIDYNFDGKQLLPRRQGWWLMFNSSIQGTYNVQGRRGGCPNQDLFQVIGILSSNRACSLLVSSRNPPINNDQIRFVVNQAVGFTTQARSPDNGPFFTETGMIMECFGVNGGGGLEFNYGANVLMLLIHLIRELDPIQYKDVYERVEFAFNHYARYIYTAYQDNNEQVPLGSITNPAFLRHPTSVETRADFQPDVIVPMTAQCASIYHAVTNRNSFALRILHIKFMQNLWLSTPINFDTLVHLLPLWNNLTDVIFNAYDDRYVDTAFLPSELSTITNLRQIIGTPDNAFVEVTAACAFIKYGKEQLFINMNYRHGLNSLSNLVRLLYHGTNTSQIVTMRFNSTDGFWGLWTMNFGDYFIAINRNKNQSYPFNQLNYHNQTRLVIDLITNTQYDLQRLPSIPPWSAWVWMPDYIFFKNVKSK